MKNSQTNGYYHRNPHDPWQWEIDEAGLLPGEEPKPNVFPNHTKDIQRVRKEIEKIKNEDKAL